MVKIPPAKNRLVIDHRAPQTDCNVSQKANPKARLDHLQALGNAANSELGDGSRVLHGAPWGRICTCRTSGASPHLYFCQPFASSFFIGFE